MYNIIVYSYVRAPFRVRQYAGVGDYDDVRFNVLRCQVDILEARCVCVCVCVCEREREREGDRERERRGVHS